MNVASFLKVVPGIRPAWYQQKDDQARTATPKETIASGANYLVISRPITESDDPLATVERIIAEIQ